MRPVLKAGLRRLWRPGGSLQVGVTPGRSLLLNGLSPTATAFLGALDGHRDIAGLLTLAEEIGLSGAHATTLLDMLARAGFLDDAAYDPGPALRALDVAEADRLAPDMAALALGYLVPGGAVRAMTRRRMAVVAVYGCGRVGASVAHMLASAGIGCVVPIDSGRARAADAAPAGFRNPRGLSHRDEREVPAPRRGRGRGSRAADSAAADTVSATTNTADPQPDDESNLAAPPPRRQDLVRTLIRTSAPSTRTTMPANRQRPDVAVLAPIADGYPAQAATLQSDGVPHVPAEVHETTGVLGPFVQPGRTSCLRCRDLYRTARDPGWPRAMVPFGGVDAVPAAEDRACDVTMATHLAVQTALHVLAFVEGDPPPTMNATLELAPPFGAQTRHERPPHPDCGCLVDLTEEAPAGSYLSFRAGR
ncbi:UBA/ThiF-type NAD/FAD binding protein [Catenulispora acidiphila DSM 44928]|uniref:UBA/ThiF-type NAD/FAD binding protein n=1 Tax=Catenulispora acidiphila (strain DSM 44928 / JCM 14897 / NBRC 102108 / NRRL B-24433 / ID139908) TaxID=479433 RepID=C7QFI3_CATAD|nr:UBA/ThiF-type NAD/FAD binding protein [Catenulispora acidiphila DSM 44928]